MSRWGLGTQTPGSEGEEGWTMAFGVEGRSLVPTGRTEGLIFGRASLELCPEMRGRPPGLRVWITSRRAS